MKNPIKTVADDVAAEAGKVAHAAETGYGAALVGIHTRLDHITAAMLTPGHLLLAMAFSFVFGGIVGIAIR